MKKILAILLAVCLTLSLSVVAFASEVSPSPEPETPSTPDISNPEIGKLVSSATAANGSRVDASVTVLPSADPIAAELKDNTPVAVYAIDIRSAVDDGVNVTFDVYAPGASENDIVLVRDEWDVLEGANLKVNGNRATFTVPAGTVKQWKYFAIVKDFNTVEVEDPKQDTGNVTDDPADGDEMNAGDQTEDPKEEDNTPAPSESENPPTGVVLAVIPMIVAAAAIVISKKR